MKYKIVHLDCARKYFSPAALRQFIDLCAACGYTQLELYFSDNQGFRLALDDMLFEAQGESFDLRPALGDGWNDEAAGMRSDGSGKFLTAADFRALAAYSTSRDVELVPAVNTPGHMGAVLARFPELCYAEEGVVSRTSLNIRDKRARAFGLALTEKYAAFFASCGCRTYNLVADEFAQDLNGMEGVLQSGAYPDLMRYLNDAIRAVERYGLTPRLFNDTLYRDAVIGAVPPETEVCYAFQMPVSAERIAEKGHPMINASTAFFWVLGKPDWQLRMTAPEELHVHRLADGSMLHELAGGMISLWCDLADTMSDEEMLREVEPLLRIFARNRGLNE